MGTLAPNIPPSARLTPAAPDTSNQVLFPAARAGWGSGLLERVCVRPSIYGTHGAREGRGGGGAEVKWRVSYQGMGNNSQPGPEPVHVLCSSPPVQCRTFGGFISARHTQVPRFVPCIALGDGGYSQCAVEGHMVGASAAKLCSNFIFISFRDEDQNHVKRPRRVDSRIRGTKMGPLMIFHRSPPRMRLRISPIASVMSTLRWPIFAGPFWFP